jgi:hypothetical protein
MPRKIDAGELVAALGGLLVFVALFLEWFGPATGWEVFESLDLVIAALALVAIATGGAGLGTIGALNPRTLLPLGLVLLLIVLVQLVDPPPVVPDSLDVETGGWLALAGSLLIVVGGILRVASIDVTVSVGARDTRRRVPAVDRRPGAGSTSAAPVPPDPARARENEGDEPPRRRSLLDDVDPDATQPFSPVREDS